MEEALDEEELAALEELDDGTGGIESVLELVSWGTLDDGDATGSEALLSPEAPLDGWLTPWHANNMKEDANVKTSFPNFMDTSPFFIKKYIEAYGARVGRYLRL